MNIEPQMWEDIKPTSAEKKGHMRYIITEATIIMTKMIMILFLYIVQILLFVYFILDTFDIIFLNLRTNYTINAIN